MPVRNNRTQDELTRASKELWYEFWMFEETAKALNSGNFKQGPIFNALLESFLLHVRVLTDFFYPRNSRDDILAEDFISNWEQLRPPIPDALDKARTRADKRLAHLTWARLDVQPEDQPWPFEDIRRGVSATLAAFQTNVPPGSLSAKWTSASPAFN